MTRRKWIVTSGLAVLGVVWAAGFLWLSGTAAPSPADVVSAQSASSGTSAEAWNGAQLPPVPVNEEILPLVARVDPGARSLDEMLPSEAGIVVEGRVLGPDGEPVAGAAVRVIPDGQTLAASFVEPPPYAPFIGLGREGPHRLDYVSTADLPVVFTDETGSFSVPTPSVAGRGDSRTPHDDSGMQWGLTEPVVVITSLGLSTATPLARTAEDGRVGVGDVSLPTEARITGRVVDASGEPVGGATVRVEQLFPRIPHPDGRTRPGAHWVRALLPAEHSTTTDSGGHYTLDGLWGGTTDLAAFAPAFARTRLGGLELAAGETLSAPELVLAPGGRITGRVVTVGGQPLAGATVMVTESPRSMGGHGCIMERYGPADDSLVLELEVASDWRTLVTRTGESGEFLLTGVPYGNLTVYAVRRGWEPVRVADIGADTIGLEMTMEPEAQLQVRVVGGASADVAQATLRGASLSARRISGVMNENTPLDVEVVDDGFLVRGAGPLGTALKMSAAGFADAVVNATGVPVGERRVVTVRMEPECRIVGRLLDADGEPLAEIPVWMHLPEREYQGVAKAVTDASGAFVLAGMRDGSYVLAMGGAPNVLERRPVVLGVGEAVNLEVRLPRAGRIEGRVLSASGEPLIDQAVRIDPPLGERTRYARSGDDGRFQFEGLRSGSHRVSVGQLGALDVHVEAGVTSDVELDLRAEPILRGHVRCQGKPVVGALVSWTLSDGFRVTTDEQGFYELIVRKTGDGRVRVQAPAGYWLPGPRLSLDWGDERDVDMSVPSGGIEGRVVQSTTGKPVAELLLNLVSNGLASKGEFLASGTTDASGHYAFVHLPAGGYSVSLSPRMRQWRPFDRLDVDLIGDDDRQLAPDVLLHEGGAISGRVLLPSGVPASDRVVVRAWRVGQSSPMDSIRVHHGRFDIRALRDGTYRLAVLDRYDAANDPEHDPDAGVLVDVVEGAPVRVTLEAPAAR